MNRDTESDDIDPGMDQFEAEQCVANARIEGFVPDAEFTANFAAAVAGKISPEQFVDLARKSAQRIEDRAGHQAHAMNQDIEDDPAGNATIPGRASDCRRCH